MTGIRTDCVGRGAHCNISPRNQQVRRDEATATSIIKGGRGGGLKGRFRSYRPQNNTRNSRRGSSRSRRVEKRDKGKRHIYTEGIKVLSLERTD